MKDRTQPLPAPAGFKWVITDTWLSRGGVPCVRLGPWPEDAEPDRLGMAFGKPRRKKGPRPPIFPVGSSIFTKERQIRKASKEALREYERHLRDDEFHERLLGREI